MSEIELNKNTRVWATPKIPCVSVCNMESPSGNTVANQFLIMTDAGTFFQSYDSVIAFKDKDGQIFLDETYWNFSMTTSKYRNIFLSEDVKTTRRKIKEGIYILTDLNRLG